MGVSGLEWVALAILLLGGSLQIWATVAVVKRSDFPRNLKIILYCSFLVVCWNWSNRGASCSLF